VNEELKRTAQTRGNPEMIQGEGLPREWTQPLEWWGAEERAGEARQQSLVAYHWPKRRLLLHTDIRFERFDYSSASIRLEAPSVCSVNPSVRKDASALLLRTTKSRCAWPPF